MQEFNSTFNYKVIYIFSINSPTHKGLLKIGDTTLKTNKPLDKLFPNSSDLKKAANERIKTYTNTALIEYKLLYTEIAARTETIDSGVTILKAFRDHHVHRVLISSGYKRVKTDNSKGKEWFKIDLSTAIQAIATVKENRKILLNATNKEKIQPIQFRPEQTIAINKTIKQFKKSDKMLWNAKMRFGKTLSALQVVKEMNFSKTIIATHRPVVNDGWYEDFKKIFYHTDEFLYGSKANGVDIKELEKSCKNYVYFVSIQDLRGSDKAGGKFDKNEDIFNINWDLVVVDEAHEGTKTSLGENVVTQLVKEGNGYTTKFLALSGTPFNIVHEFNEDELYTWDYVMEQKAKNDWNINNFGDSNPYEELPKLNIFTYNLGKLIKNGNYQEIEDKAFNFREFFRTWTGNISIDFKPLTNGSKIGDFVHKDDIISFLNLITNSSDSNYPYANETFINLFKHSLWMLPGVKEAKALSKLLEQHTVFGCGLFDIVNVAGDGDKDEESNDALIKVKKAISNAKQCGMYTITLSCGKLTTGVTIPEWTAVMMLSGSYSTSASNYLQTIFRVQSPANIDGKMKENCYVFDFAPDRTLKMVADAVNLSAKAGKTSSSDRIAMGEFLNFCPVVSVDGTIMKKYDENRLLQQLKRAYAERAVKNGFDDNSIYNDIELSKLTQDDLSKFEKLKKVVGSSKTQKKTEPVVINDTGLTDEKYEERKKAKNKQQKDRTKEEQEEIDKLKEKQQNRAKAISNLRALSIRIPLLIYGADVDFDEDISAKKLVDLVDNSSWEEFMPTGISKEMFKEFIKYYDADVFVAAGRRIKSIVKQADELAPLQRIEKITQLFKCFKNPDKETVLTPWRVVNMHMSDCLGGYSFFDETHSKILELPRLVDRGQVTKDTFANKNCKILEINSKTGLYPLYITYSIFRYKHENLESMSVQEQNNLWYETIRENVFIICKTPMAKAITKRTLCGYNDVKVNSHYFDDLINMLKNKPSQFVERALKPSYWNLKGSDKVKFDAIVGNPPYMEIDGGAQASAKPIYQYFIDNSKKIQPEYLSMVIPTRWYAGGKGLDEFRDTMLNDKCIRQIHDFLNPDKLFPNTNIRGGVCYFLWDKNYDNKLDLVKVVSHSKDTVGEIVRPLKIDGADIFIRDFRAVEILNKVNNENFESLSKYVSTLRPFGFRGYFTKDIRYHSDENDVKSPVICYGKGKLIGYIERNIITIKTDWIDKWKVFIPRANNIGTELSDDNLNSFIGKPNTICTESYLVIGAELQLNEVSAKYLSDYLKTKFARFLHSISKASQDATSKTFKFVPMQDFTTSWTDNMLYQKYNLTQCEIDYIESTIKPMK